jgi:hypothetical protein
MPDQSDELRRLIAEAERFFRQSEQLAFMFDEEMARIWRDWARALERLLEDRGGLQLRIGQVLGLKAPIRDALKAAGFDAAALMGVQAASNRWIPRLSMSETLRALQQLAMQDLLNQGDSASIALWRGMAQNVLTKRSPREIIDELAVTLNRTQAQTATLFDTQMTIFGRAVEAAQTQALGPQQPYLYAGPVDLKTRDWCLERVGKVFTREDIDAMDNEQLPNAFLTGGGYNCRHVFMAVESQALRSLAGTDERADGFDADLARVRAQKRKKAA